ncbi:50S ribosomal protein L10 [Candidatus Giovannonibacteria bacterium]|nr:50S ribosomal protein L10 [Candidatus Giovannonibacteria bacterium]
MPITKNKKVSVVNELVKAWDKASILVFVNFHGLSVAKSSKLRKELKKIGVNYKVVKKTLLKRIVESIGWKDLPRLEGEVGVVTGMGEVTEPPRIVAKFIKEQKEGLAILGGIYESKFVEADIIKKLAAIPSREALLTQLAFILNQPVASFARALNEVGKKLETN